MAVGCTPNRQEADNRNGSACSQRAESYRRPNQKWQREKEKSQIDTRSKLVKYNVPDQQQTEKENTRLQIMRELGRSQGRNSGCRPRHDYECRERIGEESYTDQLPVTVLPPMIRYDKRGV